MHPSITITRPAAMSKREAMEATRRARKALRDGWLALLDLHDREGWRSLGYSSWRDFVAVELQMSRGHAQRLLDAAQVVQSVSNWRLGDKDAPQNEAQCRELARLPAAELRRLVWEEAQADGDTSATALRDLVAAELSPMQVDGRADEWREEGGGRPRAATSPAAASGTDWPARIAKKVLPARQLHRKLGQRKQEADRALDAYLQVVRGQG